MPLVTIRRDPALVDDRVAVTIRNALIDLVARHLKVEPGEVEVRVRDVGPLDINYPPLGIEIDTGTGHQNWRVEQRHQLTKEISIALERSGILDKEWLRPDKAYVWLRICQSSFTPVGYPELTR